MSLSLVNGSPVASDPGAVGSIPLAQKGTPNGVATLDGEAKVPGAQIPPRAISDVTGLQAALDGRLPVGGPVDCTNAQRIAGSGPVAGLVAGRSVRVTDQGNRVELYRGGGYGSDANWQIEVGSYEVRVTNTLGSSLVYNGVTVAAGASNASVSLWVQEGATLSTRDASAVQAGSARVGELALPMQGLSAAIVPSFGQQRPIITITF